MCFDSSGDNMYSNVSGSDHVKFVITIAIAYHTTHSLHDMCVPAFYLVLL